MASSVLVSQQYSVWRLDRNDELFAELVVTGRNFPWLYARVVARAGFAQVRPLFEEELRRLDHIDEDPQAWEAAYERIRETVRLITPDGRAVPEFLLHIDGEDAWWRWSDETFDHTPEH